MITGDYSIESAVKAIQAGATDYVCKPVTPEKVCKIVQETREQVDLTRRESTLEKQFAEVFSLEGMIGRSPQMLEVFDLVRRVAPHFRTVLITGETGTGKELVARALHKLSPRAQQRIAVFNCSALVDTLAESQLFGHRKGAFTGAISDQAGIFEWANGGTVFLDEVGDLSPAAQSKLLRVLENGEVQKLGFPQAIQVDVQVIAATSRDLNVEMRSNRFRPDLWYRLNMVQIRSPLCGNAGKISCCWRGIFSGFRFPVSQGDSQDLTARGGCPAGIIHGLATLGNWKTSSAAVAC